MMSVSARSSGLDYWRGAGTGAFAKILEPGDLFQMVAVRRGAVWFSCGEARTQQVRVEAGGIICTTGPMRQHWCSANDRASGRGGSDLAFYPLGETALAPSQSDVEMLLASAPLTANPSLRYFPTLFYLTPAEVGALPCLEMLVRLIESEGTSTDEDCRSVVGRAGELMLGILARELYRREPQNILPVTRRMDPKLLRAIRLIETESQRSWTVETLAAEVGMGRSAFAVKFRELIGDTPLNCLFKTRMRSAARLISVEGQSIARVADAIGYQSESAFSKAFVRHFGLTPGQYRAAANDALREREKGLPDLAKQPMAAVLPRHQAMAHRADVR